MPLTGNRRTEPFPIAAKADEGIAKLRQYASDPSVPDLAKDTELHLILFQSRGFDLHRLEEIPIAAREI